MTALGVPLDIIVGAHTDPLGQRSVLSLLLGQRALGTERLLGRLRKRNEKVRPIVRRMYAYNKRKSTCQEKNDYEAEWQTGIERIVVFPRDNVRIQSLVTVT